MRITELIAALQAIQAEHGDCVVLAHRGRHGYQDDLRLAHGDYYDCHEYAGWLTAAEMEDRGFDRLPDEAPTHAVRVLGFNTECY